MEYYRTKDILHVMRLLDHKNINNTLVYTQLVNSENDDYNSAIAKSIEEAQKLVETGFEYVCNFNDSSDSSENANDRYKLFSKTLRGLFVAGVVGFEPTTTNLGGWCSVRTELHAHPLKFRQEYCVILAEKS